MAGQVHWEILQAIRSLVNSAATEAAAGASEAAFLAVATPRAKVFTPTELGLSGLNMKAAADTFYSGNAVDLRGYSQFSLIAKTSFGSLSAPTSVNAFGALYAWPFADSGASVLLTGLVETILPATPSTTALTYDIPFDMTNSGVSEQAAIFNWNSEDGTDFQSLVCTPAGTAPLEYLRGAPFVKFGLALVTPSVQPGTVTTSVWLAVS